MKHEEPPVKKGKQNEEPRDGEVYVRVAKKHCVLLIDVKGGWIVLCFWEIRERAPLANKNELNHETESLKQ